MTHTPPEELSSTELDDEMFAIIEAGTEETSTRFELLQREHDRRDA